jgi:hypothetical protein
MFLTEYYRPPEEKKVAKPGETVAGKPRQNPCNLPKDVQAWVQDLANALVQSQMESGGWRYPNHPPADLSNTQYAILGLRAARDCGASVPMTCFQRALEWTLALQQADGPEVHQRILGSGKPGETDYVIKAGDRARGFGYQKPESAVTGSMTTAGIAVLAICRDMLLKPRFAGYVDETEKRVNRSIRDGFAWLDKHFAVDKNPPPGAPGWHYYYLYGLERACVFGGRVNLGTHRWYPEGATYLVKNQVADGSWSTGAMGGKEVLPSDVIDTAWALLFLKKATRPVAPLPVITSGD